MTPKSNQNDLIMLPYRTDEGRLIFPDLFVKSLYLEMVKDGTAETVFYNGVIKDGDAWLKCCQRHGVCLYVVFGKETRVPAAVIWIDHFRDKTAHLNYCCFRSQMPKFQEAIKNSRRLIQEVLSKSDDNGHILDCLIGFAPVFNRKSTLFAVKCGGKIIGTLPHGAWLAKENKSVPCHIISFERD